MKRRSVIRTPLPLAPRSFGQPAGAGPVTLVQTHIGWVFLVGEYAFKIKKPVKYDFLDFTTLAQRHWACRREVDLNRRLTPDLYLGVCPVRTDRRGRRWVELPGTAKPGRLIDWAVWMQRLPEERMLNRLLQGSQLQAGPFQQIAAILCDFYRSQRGTVEPGGLGDLDAVRFTIEENLREGRTLPPEILGPGALQLIEKRALHFLDEHGDIIRNRARSGYIVDGHGDLRSENICLPEGSPPVLFDCIEFNDRFRIADSAMDIAFLAMDLEARERDDLAAAFIQRYQERCDPDLPAALLNFYLGYRAFVKGKVQAWIARELAVPPGAPARQPASRSTRRRGSPAQRLAAAGPSEELTAQRELTAEAAHLFDLAVRYALRRKPVLVVFCGAAGSGKSTLAHELARRLGCEHVATDIVRDKVIPRGLPPRERYTQAASGRTYRILFERAEKALSQKRPVILDGTFVTPANRRRAATIAQAQGAPSIAVWADCDPEGIARHLKQRPKDQAYGSEATLAVSLQQQTAFRPPNTGEGFNAICRISTSGALAEARAQAWNDILAVLVALV